MSFDGNTITLEDGPRLQSQLERVFDLMKDGKPRTLAQVEQHAGGTAASVSARLRDLRKAKFGGYTVNRNNLGDGLYEYSVQTAKVQI